MGINLPGSMDERLERPSESRRDGRLERASESRRATLRGGGGGYAMISSGECSGEENWMRSIGGEDGEGEGKREDREGGWDGGMG